jgi:ADP-ribose pyrophosphatase YjhB (NUDIX family)
MEYYELPQGKVFLISQKALIVEEKRLLMLRRVDERIAGEPQWGLPGGFLEIDESIVKGLVREVQEEAGLAVRVGKLVAVWDHWEKDFVLRDGRVCDVRIVELGYVCDVISGSIKLSEEHDRYLWADESDLRKLNISPDSSGAIDEYLMSRGV